MSDVEHWKNPGINTAQRSTLWVIGMDSAMVILGQWFSMVGLLERKDFSFQNAQLAQPLIRNSGS